MKIVAQGILQKGATGGPRGVSCFPNLGLLRDGSLIASYRCGVTKEDEDNDVEIRISRDLGATWSDPMRPFPSVVAGTKGSNGSAKFTNDGSDRLLVTMMWIDREAYPGKPLFNEETEGCLPLRILIAESKDQGATWSEPWLVDVPEDIGPPSLTSPLLRLPSGRFALSLESNKQYEDTSPWKQKVTYLYSDDGAKTFGRPHVVSEDPSGRIFNWDQRTGVAPDGSLVSFTWTYDSKDAKYLNIHRRISRDEGATWSAPGDLGFSDQPSCPAIFPDGRVVLAWVDRFGTQSIRVRETTAIDGEFSEASEVVLWDQSAQNRRGIEGTGGLLSDMGIWNYGLPFALALPNGEAMVVFYASDGAAMDIHWVRLAS